MSTKKSPWRATLHLSVVGKEVHFGILVLGRSCYSQVSQKGFFPIYKQNVKAHGGCTSFAVFTMSPFPFSHHNNKKGGIQTTFCVSKLHHFRASELSHTRLFDIRENFRSLKPRIFFWVCLQILPSPAQELSQTTSAKDFGSNNDFAV